jgi:glycosyltransferase involved in cell wall biosynthesis
VKLYASMIVRDELDRYLPETIDRLLEFCDEIMVLDDGSRDGTADWLREHGREKRRRILVLRNETSVWDQLGEGAARGQLLDFTLVRQPAPDWVLSIDADEWVSDGSALRAFLEGHDPWEVPAAVTLRICEVWDRRLDCDCERGEKTPLNCWDCTGRRWGVRTDGGWAPREVPVVWTPPHRKLSAAERWRYGWTIPARKLACGREPECVRFLEGSARSDVDLLHLGWSNPDERQARYDRYMKLDGGRFHADAHLRSIVEPPTLEPYPAPWRHTIGSAPG